MAAVDVYHESPFDHDSPSKPRTIRLLNLVPAASRTDDIHCTISQACLDESIQYEALSYTWGDATQECELYCNGKPLSITSNLATALRYLRQQKDLRTLWVDAVCINQANQEEKSQQIALMGDIYAKAYQVVAWIGEENSVDAGAMDFEDHDPLPDDSPVEKKVLKLIALHAKLSSSLIAARELIQRPWFGRAWIIQEAALAARLQIQCGEKIIDWESLYANLKLMSETSDANGVPLTFGNIFYQRLEFIESTRNSIKAATSGKADSLTTPKEKLTQGALSWKEFHSAVNTGRLYGASDQRDHIYALLGLIGEDDARVISVDYSRSFAAVYRDFVRQVIKQTGSLTVLGQVDSSTTTGLESWVPDYSKASVVEPLCNDTNPIHSASGDSKTRMMESDDPSVLALAGIFIDTIDEVAIGPSTDKEKVFSRSERLVHRSVDKVHPTEIVPKLAYKAVSHYFPKGKEAIDSIARARVDPRGPEKVASVNGAEPEDRNRYYKNMFDTLANLGSADKIEGNEELRNKSLALFGSLFKSMRTTRQDYFFGPMHPVNDVYMKPALEEQWQRLAQTCDPYPTGEDIEEVYWRTLIGNRHSDFTGTVDKPPACWEDAYHVWHEQLWEKEGLIPRALHGRGLRLKEGLFTWGGMSPVKGKEQSPISESLQTYARYTAAKQKRVTFDGHLMASGMRDIMALVISMSIEDPKQNNQGKLNDSKSNLGGRITPLYQSSNPAQHDQKQDLHSKSPQINVNFRNTSHTTTSISPKPPSSQSSSSLPFSPRNNPPTLPLGQNVPHPLAHRHITPPRPTLRQRKLLWQYQKRITSGK
ncbi:MAG: hypothetical protein Q9170_007295, partial [Blastenia crenularia]